MDALESCLELRILPKNIWHADWSSHNLTDKNIIRKKQENDQRETRCRHTRLRNTNKMTQTDYKHKKSRTAGRKLAYDDDDDDVFPNSSFSANKKSEICKWNVFCNEADLMQFQEFSKMSSSVSGCNSLDTIIQVCLSFTDPPPKKSRAFFPRGPCFPWRPATAKIPPLTYKDIILYTHRGTESLLSCSWCSCVSHFALSRSPSQQVPIEAFRPPAAPR